MNLSLADKVARAVLYEGYILYPYRPDTAKNRQRWTFGGLYPRSHSLAQGGSDAWAMRTQCLVEGGPEAILGVTVRFLHLVARQVGELAVPLTEWPGDREPAFTPVERLDVDGKPWHSWQEAVERNVRPGERTLEELVAGPVESRFAFPAHRTPEPLRQAGWEVVGVVVREQQAVEGAVELSAERAGDGLFKVRVNILNLTPLEGAGHKSRDEALSFMRKSQVIRSGRFELVDVVGAGDKVVVVMRPPAQGAEPASPVANLTTFRNGKVEQIDQSRA